MKKMILSCIGGLVATGISVPAVASPRDPKWILRGAITQLDLADKISLSVSGAPVPGAEIHTKTHYTPTFQVSRLVTDHVAVSLTAGIPPHIAIDGRGSLAPFGRLAETTYGPATLTVQYHPLTTGTIRPWVGAGAAYMIVFSTKDAAFGDVRIENDLAPALEAGTDVMLTPRYGVFFEAKKAFLRTRARGTFAGMPVVGDVKLDPWALSAGATLRF